MVRMMSDSVILEAVMMSMIIMTSGMMTTMPVQ